MSQKRALPMMPILKAGDSVEVIWSDGSKVRGTYMRQERGYIVVMTDDGVMPCLPSHLLSIKKV